LPELHDLAARIAALIEDMQQPPEPMDNPNRAVVEERRTPTATLRLELVNCGKSACKTCGGRRPAHGPYWYAYWKENRRTRSHYIGKDTARRMILNSAPAGDTLSHDRRNLADPAAPVDGATVSKSSLHWLESRLRER
jgi:hypothetical protein